MRSDSIHLPRVLSRAQARDLGYSDDAIDHRLTIGRWQLILPHTVLTSDTLTWEDRLVAAVTFAGDGALLSGRAALGGLGMRSVQRPDRVLVIVPAGRQPRSVRWVRVRPSARPMRAATGRGVPRVEVARAVTDACIGVTRQDDVRAMVADAVRLRLCTIDELAAELRHCPRRGSAYLREAIDEVGGGAWSAPEARAATLMRRAGFPHFEQNITIPLPDGSVYYADFLWEGLRAILEIDSEAHHTLAGGDGDGTGDRHLVLETLGYSVVHRTPRLVVRQPERFLRGMRAWLDSRPEVVSAR